MNEAENFEHQQSTTTSEVTPPPFRQTKEDSMPQGPTASPTLIDRARAMGLEDGAAQQLSELTQGIHSEEISDALLTALALGITHDEDVQNADAAGYLRGRNEKIEAVLHPQPQDEEDTHATPVFPRYCRRSIWD